MDNTDKRSEFTALYGDATIDTVSEFRSAIREYIDCAYEDSLHSTSEDRKTLIDNLLYKFVKLNIIDEDEVLNAASYIYVNRETTYADIPLVTLITIRYLADRDGVLALTFSDKQEKQFGLNLNSEPAGCNLTINGGCTINVGGFYDDDEDDDYDDDDEYEMPDNGVEVDEICTDQGFYVGDISTVLLDGAFSDVWCSDNEFEEGIYTYGGYDFGVFLTGSEDKSYTDSEGHTYDIPNMTIGIVPLELIKKDSLSYAKSIGRIIEGQGSAYVFWKDGRFSFVFDMENKFWLNTSDNTSDIDEIWNDSADNRPQELEIKFGHDTEEPETSKPDDQDESNQDDSKNDLNEALKSENADKFDEYLKQTINSIKHNKR